MATSLGKLIFFYHLLIANYMVRLSTLSWYQTRCSAFLLFFSFGRCRLFMPPLDHSLSKHLIATHPIGASKFILNHLKLMKRPCSNLLLIALHLSVCLKLINSYIFKQASGLSIHLFFTSLTMILVLCRFWM